VAGAARHLSLEALVEELPGEKAEDTQPDQIGHLEAEAYLEILVLVVQAVPERLVRGYYGIVRRTFTHEMADRSKDWENISVAITTAITLEQEVMAEAD
jgi:hypothetical protein